MSTESQLYDLAEQTRYRYESDLDMFMLFNAGNDEFRVAGALAYDIIAGIEEGMSVDELANQLDISRDAVATFCQECFSCGFIERAADG